METEAESYGCTWDNVLERHGRRRTQRRVMRGAAATMVVLIAGAGWIALSGRQPGIVAEGLRDSAGKMISEKTVFASAATVHFHEGSTIEVGNTTRLSVTENSANRFSTRLEQGRVAFDVVPSPSRRKRRWSLTAGTVVVRVVGTQFSVERADGWIDVTVTRGTVQVSGATVPGESQNVIAGQSLRVPEQQEEPSSVGPPVSNDRDPTPAQEPEGETPTVDILSQTDALRRRGQHQEAAALLQQALKDAPRSSEAPLWAFSLGQIQLDTLHRPRAAARTFEWAQRRGLPTTLREQAAARAVESWARAGQYRRAKIAAARYLSAFPNGTNRNLVLRWLERADAPREGRGQ